MQNVLGKALLDVTTAACVISLVAHWILGQQFNKAVAKAGLASEIKKHWSSTLQWSGLIFVPPHVDTFSARKLTEFRKANQRRIAWNVRLDMLGIISLMASLLLLIVTADSPVAELVALGLSGVVFPLGGAYLVTLGKAMRRQP